MGNQYAHIKMLKYSFTKITNIEEYDEKLDYLNDFREKKIIDQESYDELRDFLEKKEKEIKQRKE